MDVIIFEYNCFLYDLFGINEGEILVIAQFLIKYYLSNIIKIK
jgi:hypothetical protein